MERRALLWLGAAALALQAVVSVAAWVELTSAARVAVHFSAQGIPDGYAGRGTAVTIFPITTVLVLAAGAVSAEREKSARSAHFDRFAVVAASYLFVVLHVALLSSGLGWKVSVPEVTLGGLAVLLIVLGFALRRPQREGAAPFERTPPPASSGTRNRRERVAGLGLVAVGAVVLVLVLVPFATTIVQLAVLLAGLGVTGVATARTAGESPLG
jgi:hypothetical protein